MVLHSVCLAVVEEVLPNKSCCVWQVLGQRTGGDTLGEAALEWTQSGEQVRY